MLTDQPAQHVTKPVAKPDRRQQSLALDRRDRLALIDNCNWLAVGVTARQRQTIRALLRAIEFCSSECESQARISVLAAHVGVSGRTLTRAARIAENAGLLKVSARVNSHGQTSNKWQVNLDALRASHKTAQAQDVGHDITSPPHDITSPPPDITSWPSKECKDSKGQIEIRSTKETQIENHKWTPENIDETRLRANRVCRSIGRCTRPRDRDMLLKASALSSIVYSTHWLYDAVEACQRVTPRPRNKWAYLQTCLSAAAVAQGRNLMQDFAKITVPDTLLKKSNSQ